MNKVIFGLSMILIVSISTLFAASYDVYYEESSSFLLPKFIFENDFIQNVILVAIPTGSAFLTSLYVTNTWQIRKEKLELQRKILDEVDDSIVKILQTLKNFDRLLWQKYTVVNTTNESKTNNLHRIKFPTKESEYPNPKFKPDYAAFLTKYAEETLGLWKFSSTIKLYCEKKHGDTFDELVENLEPARTELEKLYNATNELEFDSFHKEFMLQRQGIERKIRKFKETLIKSKIKKLNV